MIFDRDRTKVPRTGNAQEDYVLIEDGNFRVRIESYFRGSEQVRKDLEFISNLRVSPEAKEP